MIYTNKNIKNINRDLLLSPDGFIIPIIKPMLWTSFDVIKKLKYKLNIKKIGHAGTLDPYATGLLIVCFKKATKKISQFQDLKKIYKGEIIIGKTTPSFDRETDFDSENRYDHIDENDIILAKNKLIGQITQIPPIYSSVKVNGKRLYKYARNGSSDIVTIPERIVTVHEFLVTNINIPSIEFLISCSKGTYIRSLANSLGQTLGTGAFLNSLDRVQIGDISVKDAFTLDQLLDLFK